MSESLTWLDSWKLRQPIEREAFRYNDHLEETLFYSAIKDTINILLTIPDATNTILKSFSILRRVKTMISPTMGTQCLSSLYMLRVRENLIEEDRHAFLYRVINKYADSRQLQFLSID